MSKYCSNCGTELIESENFCRNCGKKVIEIFQQQINVPVKPIVGTGVKLGNWFIYILIILSIIITLFLLIFLL